MANLICYVCNVEIVAGDSRAWGKKGIIHAACATGAPTASPAATVAAVVAAVVASKPAAATGAAPAAPRTLEARFSTVCPSCGEKIRPRMGDVPGESIIVAPGMKARHAECPAVAAAVKPAAAVAAVVVPAAPTAAPARAPRKPRAVKPAAAVPGPLTAPEIASVTPGALAEKYKRDLLRRERVRVVKPGLLVNLGSHVRGGVTYDRNDLDKVRRGDREITRFETVKTVDDVAELEAATKCRSDARYLIAKHCVSIAGGIMLCPLENVPAMEIGVREAFDKCRDHNAIARYSRVSLYYFPAEVANPEIAERAVIAEASSLLAELTAAMRETGAAESKDAVEKSVKNLRSAAKRALEVEAMLTADRAAQVTEAVRAARAVANAVASRAVRGADTAAAVIAEVYTETRAVESASLDLSALSAALEASAEAAVETADLDLSAAPAPAPAPAPADAEASDLDLSPARNVEPAAADDAGTLDLDSNDNPEVR